MAGAGVSLPALPTAGRREAGVSNSGELPTQFTEMSVEMKVKIA